jgi:hypothetical protein
MKSRNLFACLVIMLSVSTVAPGTIVPTTYWDYIGDASGDFVGSEAQANASGSQKTEYSYAYGWWQLLTTEEGWFDWTYDIDASAWADIYYEDVNDAEGYGYAYADVDLGDFRTQPPYYIYTEAGAEIEDEDCGDPPDFQYSYYYPTNITTGNTDQFDVNDKIECHHEVHARAKITEGSDSSTYGWSEAYACISLSEH